MNVRPAEDLRRSLDARLVLLSGESGIDVNRLRRRLAFQRILSRLAQDSTWVLKGGFLLEERLGDRARATRDIDVTSTDTLEVDSLRAAVTAALATEVDEDGFVLRVTGAHAHAVGGGSGARLSVSVDLAQRPFATVRLDVVARPEEVLGGTEMVTLVPVLAVPGWSPVSVLSVDLGQHVAEKLHSLCTLDAHSRPSTRAKDLVDVVLLIDAGVLADHHAAVRLRAVFAVRGTPVPGDLSTPPEAWRDAYAGLVRQIDHVLPAYDDAVASARALLIRLVQSPPTSNPLESHP